MNLAKYEFSDVFQENEDGTLSPKIPVRISGVVFGTEVNFGPGVVAGGIDLHKYKNYPIAAEDENGVLVIRGFYQP